MAIVAGLALFNSGSADFEDDVLQLRHEEIPERYVGNDQLEDRIRRYARLSPLEHFVEEYSCTYLGCGLTGRLILTYDHLIWFDKCPSDDLKKEGLLWRQRRFMQVASYFVEPVQQCLFILRDETLSYYKDPTNRYAPADIISVRDIQLVQLAPGKDLPATATRPALTAFEVITSSSSYDLFSESLESAQEWIHAIRTVARAERRKRTANSQIQVLGTNSGNRNLETELEEQKPILIVIPFNSVIAYDSVEFPSLRTSAISISTNTKQFLFLHFADLTSAYFKIQEYYLYHYPEIHQQQQEAQAPSTSSSPSSSCRSNKDQERDQMFRYGLGQVPPPSPEEWVVREFRSNLNMPPTEELLAECKCMMWRAAAPFRGRLYVSSNYLSFYSNILGIVTMAVIPLQDIKKASLVHRGSLEIVTRDTSSYSGSFGLLSTSPPSASASPFASSSSSNKFSFTGWSVARIFPCLYHVWDETVSPSKREVDSIEDVVTIKPKKIVMFIVGSRGDVQPFIVFALELQKYGHIVKIATHEAHRKFVEDSKIEFLHLAGDPKDLMALCSNNDMFSFKFFKEGLANFTKFIKELLDTAWEASKGCEVIIQNPPAIAGVHIAEKLRIPLLCAFTMPWSRTHTMPNPFAVPSGSLISGNRYNYASYIAVEQGIWQPIRSIVNNFRREKLNLPSIGFGSKGHSLLHDRNVPFLYCWSPLVVPKPPDWSNHIHVTGYWFLDVPDFQPNPKLLEFISRDPEKTIYIGFGSIVIDNPDELTSCIIAAVAAAGVNAILAKGWGGFSTTKYPPCIFPIDSVPHDWLFPHLAGVVHHGGAGTTAAGFRAGVPSMIVPFFGDQFFWAEKIVELGVGCPGIPFKSLTTAKLQQSLIKLTTDPLLKQNAKKLGEKIRMENGPVVAVEAFHEELVKWDRKNKNKTGAGRSLGLGSIGSVVSSTSSSSSSSYAASGTSPLLPLTFVSSRSNSTTLAGTTPGPLGTPSPSPSPSLSPSSLGVHSSPSPPSSPSLAVPSPSFSDAGSTAETTSLPLNSSSKKQEEKKEGRKEEEEEEEEEEETPPPPPIRKSILVANKAEDTEGFSLL